VEAAKRESDTADGQGGRDSQMGAGKGSQHHAGTRQEGAQGAREHNLPVLRGHHQQDQDDVRRKLGHARHPSSSSSFPLLTFFFAQKCIHHTVTHSMAKAPFHVRSRHDQAERLDRLAELDDSVPALRRSMRVRVFKSRA
jgi:hypothetical protein